MSPSRYERQVMNWPLVRRDPDLVKEKLLD